MDFTCLDDKNTDSDNPEFNGVSTKYIALEKPEHADSGFNEQDFANKVADSVNHNASDLHLCTGYHPVLRIDGELKTFTHWPRVNASWLNGLSQYLLSDAQQRQLQQSGQVDCACTTSAGQRAAAQRLCLLLDSWRTQRRVAPPAQRRARAPWHGSPRGRCR